MFSDGIRPGGDLTELDGAEASNRLPIRRSGRSQKKVDKGSPGKYHINSLVGGAKCSSDLRVINQ